MKSIFKYIVVVLTCVACAYTACKKSEPQTPNKGLAASLSSQVALTLYKALAGSYGGPTISGGIKVFNHNSLRVNAVNSLCGYTVDTAYTFSSTAHDTTTKLSGHYTFTYTCNNNNVDGYISSDSITNAESGPRFSNYYKASQNYIVKILDPSYLLFSMSGSISTTNHTSVLNASHVTIEYHDLSSKYTLQDVKVDFTDGTADITSGTATFNSNQTALESSAIVNGYIGGYSGNITFLGKRKAKVIIHLSGSDITFIVNLLTGETTAS